MNMRRKFMGLRLGNEAFIVVDCGSTAFLLSFAPLRLAEQQNAKRYGGRMTLWRLLGAGHILRLEHRDLTGCSFDHFRRYPSRHALSL